MRRPLGDKTPNGQRAVPSTSRASNKHTLCQDIHIHRKQEECVSGEDQPNHRSCRARTSRSAPQITPTRLVPYSGIIVEKWEESIFFLWSFRSILSMLAGRRSVIKAGCLCCSTVATQPSAFIFRSMACHVENISSIDHHPPSTVHRPPSTVHRAWVGDRPFQQRNRALFIKSKIDSQCKTCYQIVVSR